MCARSSLYAQGQTPRAAATAHWPPATPGLLPTLLPPLCGHWGPRILWCYPLSLHHVETRPQRASHLHLRCRPQGTFAYHPQQLVPLFCSVSKINVRLILNTGITSQNVNVCMKEKGEMEKSTSVVKLHFNMFGSYQHLPLIFVELFGIAALLSSWRTSHMCSMVLPLCPGSHVCLMTHLRQAQDLSVCRSPELVSRGINVHRAKPCMALTRF